MYKVWLNNGTIFENYWQEDNTGKAPITMAGHDFVGWSRVVLSSLVRRGTESPKIGLMIR